AAGTHRQQEASSGELGFLFGHVVLLMNERSYPKQGDVNPQIPLIQARSSELLGDILTNERRDENDSH
ncbi:MAG TPA: hypothetical protein VI730_00565, partial [Burkholderiales bacterium]|nr:hypothetical protein [Burkholderiales bacterium]